MSAEQATADEIDEDVDEDESEQPDVPGESMADAVDLDAVDSELDEDDQDDEAADTDQGDDVGGDDLETLDESGGSSSWGDYYVKGLVSVSNAVVDEYGDEDAEEIDEGIARDLDLDDAFDEWMEQHGGTSEMEPGQAVLIGTLMFLLAVVAANTEVVHGIMDNLDLDTDS